MKKPIEERNPEAVKLGSLGGRAGRGAIKARGDGNYYRELARLAVEARRAKQAISS